MLLSLMCDVSFEKVSFRVVYLMFSLEGGRGWAHAVHYRPDSLAINSTD